jgi:hypothetical protein
MTDVDFGGISEEKYNIWKEDLMPKKKKKLKKKKKAKKKTKKRKTKK